MKKTVLLTGATGFVGRQIYKNLLNLDVNISIIAREESLRKLPELNHKTNITYSENLFKENLKWWETALEDVNILIHSAWYAEPGLYLQSDKNIECLIGTLNMAKIASKMPLNKFIGIGSCFEYDLTGSNPLISEAPLNPNTLYSSTKVAAYYTLRALFSQENIPFAWCRLFYLYGEGEDPRRFIPYLHQKLSNGEVAALTSGDQIRDYMDVYEAGKLIADLSLTDKAGAINICSGQPQSIKSIAQKIANQYGRLDLLKFGARKENLLDPPIIIGVPN